MSSLSESPMPEPKLDRHDYMAAGGGPLAEDPNVRLWLKLATDRTKMKDFTAAEIEFIRTELLAIGAIPKVERMPEDEALITLARSRLRRFSVPDQAAA